MKWLERLFHEPRDQEVDEIRADLKTETVRHGEELTKINGALRDLAGEYERAEKDRQSQ